MARSGSNPADINRFRNHTGIFLEKTLNHIVAEYWESISYLQNHCKKYTITFHFSISLSSALPWPTLSQHVFIMTSTSPSSLK